MRIFPKLIKEEYITSFKDHPIWVQNLSFIINRRIRNSILENADIYSIREKMENYLKIKNRAKILYLYVNSKKNIRNRKSPQEINNEFNRIEKSVKENLSAVLKEIYLLEIPKGIQKIKDRVEKTKKYFVANLRKLPTEICRYILTFTFIW